MVLQKLQKKEYELLCIVDDICRKYDIQYSLAYGTALGAVRHQGFIPWDDDIDIMMTFNEFMRFRKAFKKEKIQHTYIQSNYDNDNTFVVHGRVGFSNTANIPKDLLHIRSKFGICIDIFVLFPLESMAQFPRIIQLLNTSSIFGVKGFRYLREDNTKLYIIRNILKFVPKCVLSKISLMFARKANRLHQEVNYYVDYVDDNLCLDAKLFSKYTTIMFENREFMIIEQVHEYLGKLYGNLYMELPPESERYNHQGDTIVDFNQSYAVYR